MFSFSNASLSSSVRFGTARHASGSLKICPACDVVRDHLGLVDSSSTGAKLSTKDINASYLDKEAFLLLEAVIFHKALDLTFDVMNVRQGVIDAA